MSGTYDRRGEPSRCIATIAMVAMTSFGGLSPAAAQRREPPPSRPAMQYVVRADRQAGGARRRQRLHARPGVSQLARSPTSRCSAISSAIAAGCRASEMQSALGSGVIVSSDGVIVTNTHVVKVGATSEIRIVLADRREFDAKVVLQDEKTDIAILRIEGGDGNFPSLQIRRFRRGRGRRSGARDRQSVRGRADRDERHNIRARPLGDRSGRYPVLYPNRRRR